MWGQPDLPDSQAQQACVAPPVLQVQRGRKALQVILVQLAHLGHKVILARKALSDPLVRKALLDPLGLQVLEVPPGHKDLWDRLGLQVQLALPV
jgi:hypothetical protein